MQFRAQSSNMKKRLVRKSFRISCGPLAQVVEHLPFKQRVAGSSPARLTKFNYPLDDDVSSSHETNDHKGRSNSKMMTTMLIRVPKGMYQSPSTAKINTPHQANDVPSTNPAASTK